MKNRIQIVLITITLTWLYQTEISAQYVGLSGGPGINRFFDYAGQSYNSAHLSTEYDSKFGWSAGLQFQNLRIDSFKFSANLSVTQIGGNIRSSDGGLGGGTVTDAQIEKTLLCLGIYPFHIRFFKKHLQISAGVEFNYLLSQQTTGYHYFWSVNTYTQTYYYQDGGNNINNPFAFGINIRAAYFFKISEDFYIAPALIYYAGLFADVSTPEINMMSSRKNAEIGLFRKF